MRWVLTIDKDVSKLRRGTVNITEKSFATPFYARSTMQVDLIEGRRRKKGQL